MNEMNEEVNARMILAAIEILRVAGIWLARWGSSRLMTDWAYFAGTEGTEGLKMWI